MKISKITLGTVNFGLNYGLRRQKRNKIPKKKAVKIIKKAIRLGINSFDTSPNYGNAEKILGEALGNNKKCFIATKIFFPPNKKINFKEILNSIGNSCKNLNRKNIDLIQIHNANKKIFQNSSLKIFLNKLKKKKIIKKIGATLYTEQEAIAAIKCKWIDTIQVPYNILNQKMHKRVFILAKKNRIKIFTRSTFLKGVLTEKLYLVPKKLKPIRKNIEKNLKKLSLNIDQLKFTAFKFSSSNRYIDSIVLGVDKIEQLEELIDLKKIKFSKKYLNRLSIFDLKSKLSDPRLWPFI